MAEAGDVGIDLFQSTLPMKGATQSDQVGRNPLHRFNPRSQ